MSLNNVTQHTTDDMVEAAVAVATAHMARNPRPVPPGETGEQYVPLATLDMLITAPTPPLWTITIYLRTGDMPIVAIITNHDGGKVREPHAAYINVRLAKFQEAATGELWVLVEPRQEGSVAA